jgi:hypothetical protein
MSIYKSALSSILLLSALFCFNSVAQARTSYQLNVELNTDTATLQGELQLQFTHEGKEPLKELFFRLDANTQARMQIREVLSSDKLVLPGRHYRYTYLGHEIEDPLLYQVFLSQPLEPGQSLKLTFRYVLEHLPQVDRSYYLIDDPNRLGIGSWYPRLVTYQDGQWQPEVSEISDYNISAKVLDKLFAISPLAPVSLSSSDHTYRYSAERQMGLDLIFTPDLLMRAADVDDMQLRYYYPGKLQKWSTEALQITEEILRFFKQRYGVFPSKRLTIVSAEDSKYPVISSQQLLVLRNSFAEGKDENRSRQQLTEWLIYGIAQQYWGQRVRQNQKFVPWITQGLALYTGQVYMQQKRKNYILGDQVSENYLRSARQGWSTSLQTPRMILDHLPFNNFSALAQGKGYTIFRMLDVLLGKRALESTEIQLQKKYLNKELDSSDFQTELEKIAGKDLQWFFQQWVQESHVVDYGIQSLQVSGERDGKYTVTVTVQRLGEAIMPVSIAIVLKSGEVVFHLWDGASRSERLSFEVNAEVKEVRLDPSSVTPDVDRSNNRFVNNQN